jgi:hypothetical protein
MLRRKAQLLLIILSASLLSCGGVSRPDRTAEPPAGSERNAMTKIPAFNPDSAYAYVARQVAFGPRVPNTDAHKQCGDWLTETMERFADTVYVQQARVRAYNGHVLNIRNIIGVFNPERKRRMLLCAHWDSRPYADYDPDPAYHYTPIDGANDGASGVGVLIEIARQLSKTRPDIGIDIIFFDAEDYGKHRQAAGGEEDSWALGAQHWSRSPHIPSYDAQYGILFDMVGAANATFKKEGYSMLFAPHIVRKVWDAAAKAGYGHYFLKEEGGYITDDHYYVNQIRDIPTINIIHQDKFTTHGFFPQWHTMDDNMDIIDKNTLQAAGQTVLHVIFGSN